MEGRSEFARPASLALMAIAAVGWLVAVYFWSQSVGLRAEGEEALRRAEVARQELVGELQTLQASVGSAADLRKKLDDGRKALDDAVAQRTSVQNDLAELTRKVDETELSLASETDQLEFEDRAAEGHAGQSEGGAGRARRHRRAEGRRRRRSRKGAGRARRRAGESARAPTPRPSPPRPRRPNSRAKVEDLAKAADAAKSRLDDVAGQDRGGAQDAAAATERR